MSIKILTPGLFSTIQDEGRIGYQNQGFSTAGALDLYAYRLAQTLINNEGPVIEITIIGPSIQFLADNTFVVTGAHFDAYVNDEPISHQTVIKVQKGDKLKLNSAIHGARGYIAFGQPIDVPLVANSYATHTRSQIGGYKGRALRKGDVLAIQTNHRYLSQIGISSPIENYEQQTIHIIEGPQIEQFSEEAKSKLTSGSFKISEKSDRMGFRLQGENIAPLNSADIISEPVALGSVQVPKDGNPIILLNDKQTVGGYTKIATVCAADLSLLAQKQPGETIKFQWQSIEEAVNALKQKEEHFSKKLKELVEKPIFDIKQLRPTASRIKNLLKGEL
ncbi:biotin-dependent carboxyltransferase [Staphylococcus sp. GSSP0090]|nr:biotin-dependent carboxyltransferase [Staphylococcus sp. GSSP0090]